MKNRYDNYHWVISVDQEAFTLGFFGLGEMRVMFDNIVDMGDTLKC